jgi:hypothetical protein
VIGECRTVQYSVRRWNERSDFHRFLLFGPLECLKPVWQASLRLSHALGVRSRESLDDNFTRHSERPVQRLRAFQGVYARPRRYEVDLFAPTGGDAEAAAALLRLRRGFPGRNATAEELRRREGLPSLINQ